MEGHGVMQAAHQRNVDALVVRGISDLLDGKAESDRTGWQPRAARHAAAFAMQVLAKL
jgi:nucleoside phosphorylase